MFKEILQINYTMDDISYVCTPSHPFSIHSDNLPTDEVEMQQLLSTVEMDCTATKLEHVGLKKLLGFDLMTNVKYAQMVGDSEISYNLPSYDMQKASLDFKHDSERLYEKGDIAGALKQVNWAMSLNPQGKWLHFDRGLYYSKVERYNESLYDFTQEIVRSPNNALIQDRSHYERGIVYVKLGENDKALLDFQAVIHSDNALLSELANKRIEEQESMHASPEKDDTTSLTQSNAKESNQKEGSINYITVASAALLGYNISKKIYHVFYPDKNHETEFDADKVEPTKSPDTSVKNATAKQSGKKKGKSDKGSKR